MDRAKLLACINFFKQLSVTEEDVTTDQERANGQLIVKITYRFNDKSYTTQKLYYEDIAGINDIKNKNAVLTYFNTPVYWLDVVRHDWPKGSGQSDLEKIVINEMAAPLDYDFKLFLKTLANNDQNGYLQQITAEGRTAQYFHNLENNNHWHDLIYLIKAIIDSKGEIVNKEYFSRLVFKWDGDKNSVRKRCTLTDSAYPCSRSLIYHLYKNIKSAQMELEEQELVNLLIHKKQIILQGPPGTGKTHTAKKIAHQLALKSTITQEEIKNIISVGQTIKSGYNYTTYVIDAFTDNGIKVRTTNNTVYEPKYSEIIDAFQRKIWLNAQVKNGNDSYSAAIAKYIDENIENTQVKIIQFHPAYSYEDFVRGIVIKPNGNSVFYEAENKVLGSFALKAAENWNASNEPREKVSKEKWVDAVMENFKEDLISRLDEEPKIMITKKASISRVTEKSIRYNAEAWKEDGGVPISDIKRMYLADINSRNEIKDLVTLTKTARSLSTYWLKVLELFKKYIVDNNLKPETNLKAVETQNFVLIIDEINRANLPAVLGELIYALEYRGESVESMYELEEGGNKLSLPPNLYIIGTMNTADRSVGHIDYAIRRRFAFVNILPSDTVIDEVVKDANVRIKSKNLFKKVADLFTETNIATDFKANDVQLGHSYFLGQTEKELELKLKYEIKPLLKEYVKDGILQPSITNGTTGQNAEEYIDKLSL